MDYISGKNYLRVTNATSSPEEIACFVFVRVQGSGRLPTPGSHFVIHFEQLSEQLVSTITEPGRHLVLV